MLLVVAFVAAGFANGLVNPALHTIVQLRTPRALRTKLYSVVITATAILGPVALVATGPALERFGVDSTLVVLVGDRHGARAAVLGRGLAVSRAAGRELAAAEPR